MNSEYLSDHVFSVSDLCLVIKNTVSEMFFGLQVEGEVCNFRSNQSRHWYFSLKDKDGSLINCTCFAGNNWKERKPENGEVVVLRGSLSFWFVSVPRRTWMNSSRLEMKIDRNLQRSRSGFSGSLA